MIEITHRGTKIAELNPVLTGAAPDFTLSNLTGGKITLSNLTKPVLISVFPDINTPTCSLQTKHFNVEAAQHSEIEFLSISNNTPAEQKNWCAAEGVDMTVLADDGSFGQAYGLTLPNGRLARAIFVVKNGQIAYVEIVRDISDEPDYAAALAATK